MSDQQQPAEGEVAKEPESPEAQQPPAEAAPADQQENQPVEEQVAPGDMEMGDADPNAQQQMMDQQMDDGGMLQMGDPNQMHQMDPGMMNVDPNQMQNMNPNQQMEYQRQFEMQQQQQYANQMGGENQQRHYFDSIETDEFIMPQKFEVEIRMQDNSIKRVTVEVSKCEKPKHYFGGFRNNRTGMAYHHAFTQTDQQANYHPEKNERIIQTYEYKTKSTIMMREMGVQMDVGLGVQCEKTGLYMDTRKDKIIKPNKAYFSSKMWFKEREQTTLYIQCRVRAWFARKRAYELRKVRDDKDAELRRRQEELKKEEEQKRQIEIQRRMHPKKSKDFDILYNELEAWRLNETKKIKSSNELNHEEKNLALQQLLNKETKILQQIDRLKITAHEKNKTEKIANFLRAMSDPKLWKRSDGRFTEVHTPFSTRAKELMDLYNGLRLPFLSVDERLDVLLHTKWTVKEFDCNLTREIVDLIDREADMLNRGRSEKSLEGLRMRLSNLFLQFIETPEFNPEAARFQKVPRELLQQTQSIIFE